MARKKHNIHYLYKTTCNVTGRWYIGMHSTSDLEDGYMGSGKVLRYSIRKYGKENHTKEILEYFDSRELLIEGEKNVITPDMVEDRCCMNLILGGQGGGGFWSEQQMYNCARAGGHARKLKMDSDIDFKLKMDTISTNNIMKFNCSDEKKLLKTFLNKTHSEETKQLMSQKAKERTSEQNSQYGTCWITRDGLNKKIKKEDLDNWVKEGWVQGRK